MTDFRSAETDLPEAVRALFWDCDSGALRWSQHSDFILGRILSRGAWKEISWARQQIGDGGIRAYLERSQGRQLSPQQLRLWEVLLGLPHDTVSEWMARCGRETWDGRSP